MLHPAPPQPVAQEAAEHAGGTEKSTEAPPGERQSQTDHDWQKTGISQVHPGRFQQLQITVQSEIYYTFISGNICELLLTI